MATTSILNHLNNNDSYNFGVNCFDAIKLKPKLTDSEFDDVGCFNWNNLLVYITKDYLFFNFDELCRCLKRRKIKSWNNSSTWTSAFNTHFIKSGLQQRHKDRFKVLHGDQYVHVMYLEIACKGILSGFGVEWFWGEKNWDEDCGKGFIYFIYFVGEDKFKFGKADDYEERFTNYISETKNTEHREAGFKVLMVFKVNNMSLSEDIIDLYWRRNDFKKATNSREYYKIPLLEGEDMDERLGRIEDLIGNAIDSIEPEKDWDDIVEEAQSWETARLKLPTK